MLVEWRTRKFAPSVGSPEVKIGRTDAHPSKDLYKCCARSQTGPRRRRDEERRSTVGGISWGRECPRVFRGSAHLRANSFQRSSSRRSNTDRTLTIPDERAFFHEAVAALPFLF
jgi:hypothetical protein